MPQMENSIDPMTHGSVLAQVREQMLSLHLLYDVPVEHVYGVLTCYTSWRFFKLQFPNQRCC